MLIWMEISRDRFELPLAVADTAYELSKLTGEKVSTIYSCESQARKGGWWSKFIRIETEDEE